LLRGDVVLALEVDEADGGGEDYCDIGGAVFHEHIPSPADSWLAGVAIETCPQIPPGWVYIDGMLFPLVEGER
jgi:hypothetical protein